MKVRFISLFFFLLVAFALNAQNSALVLGQWKYHDVYEKEKIDADALKMLQMFFGNMTMTFHQDGQYSATLMDKAEEGKWVLANDGKTMTLNSNDGRFNEMAVVSVTESNLIIKVGQGVFILKKIKKQ